MALLKLSSFFIESKDSINFVTHTIFSAGYNFDICRDMDSWNHEDNTDAESGEEIVKKKSIRDIGVKILKTVEM